MGPYTIRLLGGFAVEEPSGAPAPALPQRRAEAMLAILAVCGSLGCSRERLMALLWPEGDEAHGRHHLRDALYAIRRAYGSTAVLTEGDIVRLDPATLRSDAQEFAAALAEGRPADAVAVYGGPFLDGFHVAGSAELERWIDDERARLFQEYQLAIKGLAGKAETGARWDAAAEWWGRLLAADPYNSRAAVRRMVALACSGDRANAIREGEAHCRRLKTELELDPDPELLQELERIRGGALEPSYFSSPPEPTEAALVLADEAQPVQAPLATAGASKVVPPIAAPRPRRPRWRSIAYLASAAALLALIGYSVYARFARRPRASREERITSVAVLPFSNLSRDPDNEYFSDGLTDELLNQLAKLPGVRVAARTSSFYFKGKNLPAKDIAGLLQVESVVEGSVQRTGGRMRIEAALISARTGYQLWSERYDREAGDLFTVQDEIARAVATAMRASLAGTLPRRGHVPDPAAYDLYLRGRFLLNRAGSRADLEGAVALFRQAVARDSLFPQPYAAAATAWEMLADAYVAPLEAYPKADSLARRALQLDSTSAEALAMEAYARLVLRWDWAGAKRDFMRAAELNPLDPIVHRFFSNYWYGRGDRRQALAEYLTGARLDPFSGYAAHDLAEAWQAVGQLDSADAALERAEEIAPGRVYFGSIGAAIRRAQGRLEEALALEQGATERLGRPTEGLVHTLLAMGRTREANEAFSRMVAESGRRYVMPELIAEAAMDLGRREEALEWLERGVAVRSAGAPKAPWSDAFRPLRTEPRYRRLVHMMGLDTLQAWERLGERTTSPR